MEKKKESRRKVSEVLSERISLLKTPDQSRLAAVQLTTTPGFKRFLSFQETRNEKMLEPKKELLGTDEFVQRLMALAKIQRALEKELLLTQQKIFDLIEDLKAQTAKWIEELQGSVCEWFVGRKRDLGLFLMKFKNENITDEETLFYLLKDAVEVICEETQHPSSEKDNLERFNVTVGMINKLFEDVKGAIDKSTESISSFLKRRLNNGPELVEKMGLRKFEEPIEIEEVPLSNRVCWKGRGLAQVNEAIYAVLCADGSLTLFSDETPAKIIAKKTFSLGATSASSCIAASPDSKSLLITSRHSKSIILCSSSDLSILKQWKNTSEYSLNDSIFLNDETIVAGYYNGEVKIIPIDESKIVQTAKPGLNAVSFLCKSKKDQHVFVAFVDGLIIELNIPLSQTLWTQKHYTSYIYNMALDSEGQTLAATSWDKTVLLMSSENGQKLQILEEFSNLIMSIGFSADGISLCVSGYDEQVVFTKEEKWEKKARRQRSKKEKGQIQSAIYDWEKGLCFFGNSANQLFKVGIKKAE